MSSQQTWEMRNAQRQLNSNRPGNGRSVKTIGEVAGMYRPGYGPIDNDPPPAPRTYRLTPLDEFRFDHLRTSEQRGKLQYALDQARNWIEACDRSRGLSFVLCGPVGTGKTTIAENLMLPFKQSCRVSNGDDVGYRALIEAAMSKLKTNDPRRGELQKLLERPSADDAPAETQAILDGILVEATDLMRIVGDEAPLSHSFGRYRVIVVDDAGTEEIDYSNERTEETKRQRRYGRFLDYCYRNHKHVIITSMEPMLAGDQLNEKFVNIFGRKAFSRLYQMSRDFMVDLSGLPDYRPYIVNGFRVTA